MTPFESHQGILPTLIVVFVHLDLVLGSRLAREYTQTLGGAMSFAPGAQATVSSTSQNPVETFRTRSDTEGTSTTQWIPNTRQNDHDGNDTKDMAVGLAELRSVVVL